MMDRSKSKVCGPPLAGSPVVFGFHQCMEATFLHGFVEGNIECISARRPGISFFAGPQAAS
jgi:hypothetical protein